MSDFEKRYYESDEFWKEGMVSDPANSIRLNKTVDLIPKEVGTLADIGCGNGLLGKLVQQRRKDVSIMSIDRSEQALKYVNTPKATGDVLDIPLESNSFDCVSCLQVLEHIPANTYSLALSELARVSKKYIIISVPFNEPIEKNATQCPKCKTVFNADLHLRSYSAEDIKSLFLPNGFECIQSENLVKGEKLAGEEIYHGIKNFLQGKEKKFLSPICPLCGYENETFNTIPEGGATQLPVGTVKTGGIKGFIKKTWPKKEVPGYWVIALYKKK
jgi:ubiquinone/menaquinone biosynthesis C-methylase UbiE